MAKKTKELEENEVTQVKKKATTKKATAKKTSATAKKSATTKKAAATTKKSTTAKKASTTTKKAATTKKASAAAKKSTTVKKATAASKKTSVKKSSSTKKSTSTKKASTTKKATETKKKATKKTAEVKKKATTKKSTTAKKSTSKTTSTRKKASTKKAKVSEVPFKSEYYDLPYMYNNTIVKVLAQTPKMLFIYWEISEEDRNNLENAYGKDFFEKTRPVLIVYNDTMHYSFEVDVNDFANSWYLHIEDANCDYHVELGRRPYPYNFSNNSEPVYIPYYIYLTSSNKMTSPNNKMLFDPLLRTVRFRNVKTGQVVDKDINQFIFITNFGIFKIKDLYEFLFPGESFEYENIVLGHTSSGALSSSGMFSSQFK